MSSVDSVAPSGRRRVKKIERAVQTALKRWPGSVVPTAVARQPAPEQEVDVVHSIPRRKPLHTTGRGNVTLPMARRVVFKPGVIRPMMRLGVWFWAGLTLLSGNALDLLLGRASVERRAARLRLVFENAGASFTKLGQQLALRADLLPYAYCQELSKMLDQAKPFPTAQAIAIIERNLGRKLHEVFAEFDPDPIGSASLACVYQARLRSGGRVAVKVRRPGVGMLLAADLRAFDWLLFAAETVTLIRPGLTRDFRDSLRVMLLRELNFRAEARYTEMFRLRSAKKGLDVTAPKVFFKYCTAEVMVSELVSGIWMWELMAAVDTDDRDFLARAAAQGIEPRVLARKLTHAVHHELLEELFFHADPHPANLVVLPNNRVCFIDFGAVGRFSSKTRNAWRELHYHMQHEDVARMVSSSLSLVGPLPPIDIDRAMKAMEEIFSDWVYANRSTDAEWWERSTAQNWLRYITVAREFGIPVNLETIQFFRATLLYDSIVTRLNGDIDFAREYKVYAREAGRVARRRVQKFLRKRMGGPTKMDYLRIEQLGDLVNQGLFRWQRSIEEPMVHFRKMVGKIAYSISMLIWAVTIFAISTMSAVIGKLLAEAWLGRELSFLDILQWVMSFGWLPFVLVSLVFIRKMLIRMNEPDYRPSDER
jgi:ubiquinone biosynthesis protein